MSRAVIPEYLGKPAVRKRPRQMYAPLETADMPAYGELTETIEMSFLDQPNEETDDDKVTLLFKSPGDGRLVEQESGIVIALQVAFPFLMGGFGTVGAGLVLDLVQHWDVFKNISEIFIMVPALLGLKGNLEMTLASRLSTAANLGVLDSWTEAWSIVSGNLILTQLQAIVVGCLASVFAIILSWIPEGKFQLDHALVMCTSSMITASLASFVLGILMTLVIVVSKKLKINPDNVATPIAASLGDLTTISVLAIVSSLVSGWVIHSMWSIIACAIVLILMTPICAYYSHINKYTRDILYTGWTPVISAMLISSFGGLILDFTVTNYTGFAIFNPIINGVGGNIVAVQASRLSTYLHRLGSPGSPPANFRYKFCSAIHLKPAIILIAFVIPGNILFLSVIAYIKAGHTSITILFTVVYVSCSMLQCTLLLITADWFVHKLWLSGKDPDNSAIPYLTALGDLCGTGFLSLGFQLLYLVGDRDSDVGE